MKSDKKIILGIDPGYDRLGIAVLSGSAQKPELLYSDCFITSRKDVHEKRLSTLGNEIKSILKKWSPGSVGIEEVFFSDNRKTALLVSQALGVIVYEASQAGIPVAYYTPAQVKIATTGYGKSTKQQITFMLEKLMKIPKKKILDDEYDAIAVGLTHLASWRG